VPLVEVVFRGEDVPSLSRLPMGVYHVEEEMWSPDRAMKILVEVFYQPNLFILS
jgi:hypothetical protein